MVRIKYRYILGQLKYENARPKYDGRILHKAILDSIQSNFGDFGIGCTAGSLNVKYCNTGTDVFILRIGRDYLRLVWSAITFITKLEGQPISIAVLHVGGTIKLCKKAAVKYDKELLLIEQMEQQDHTEE